MTMCPICKADQPERFYETHMVRYHGGRQWKKKNIIRFLIIWAIGFGLWNTYWYFQWIKGI